jgi:hypothetical protein
VAIDGEQCGGTSAGVDQSGSEGKCEGEAKWESGSSLRRRRRDKAVPTWVGSNWWWPR